MNQFIENILHNLKTNGFPEKRVALPTERMYEAADKRGLSFNKVLDQLKTDHSITAEITTDRIIFSLIQETPQKGQQDLIREAQEMMSKMDPAELKKLQEMFMNMTPEQKEEIMAKGKELGLL